MEAELGRILQNERLIRVIGRCDVFYARMPSNNKTSCSESGNDRTIGEHIAKPSETMEALDDLSFKKLIAARCGAQGWELRHWQLQGPTPQRSLSRIRSEFGACLAPEHHCNHFFSSMVKRRSKRRSTGATRFSARRQAQVQQDAARYGEDYGILPSGESPKSEISPQLRCLY